MGGEIFNSSFRDMIIPILLSFYNESSFKMLERPPQTGVDNIVVALCSLLGFFVIKLIMFDNRFAETITLQRCFLTLGCAKI